MRKNSVARIMVVTQEKGVHDFIAEFFERRGYRIWGTTDLEHAGKELDSNRYQIAILQKEICEANPAFARKASARCSRVIFSTPFSSDQLESDVVIASQKLVSGGGIKDIGDDSKLQASDRNNKRGCYA